MQFLIADTFTDSLSRLTEDERKAAKITALDLQLDPASPGLQFHRIDKSKDKNFWSVRVNRDVRIVVHRTAESVLLCYVAHHDNAYAWAERRRLETHPTTGAAQLVEVREMTYDVAIPRYVESEVPKAVTGLLFAGFDDSRMLQFGVPAEWLPDVRNATEDTLLNLADHLPAEAAEALLELATGGSPRAATVGTAAMTSGSGERLPDPFAHPDAQRRFRVIQHVEELEAALDSPWDKWTVFLHPAQRVVVQRGFNGPARVAGSAGTGKTVVAVHRAVHLARANQDARVLLTTFSEALANILRTMLRRLIAGEPRLGERIDVLSMDAAGRRLYELHFGSAKAATRADITSLMQECSDGLVGLRFSPNFLLTEWDQVVDAWQLADWPEYRDVARLGRRTRLPEAQRRQLWGVFAKVRDEMEQRGLVTMPAIFGRLAAELAGSGARPWDFVVVDEAQDIGVAQLRFLATLAGDRPNGLFFAGDLGQRIFQQPFSWKALGVDVRGRSRTLRVNYRTSHQIRAQADRLLGPELADVDGNTEERRGTVSVFNGPDPEVVALDSQEEESAFVEEWLSERSHESIAPSEMAVFVRSERELGRALSAVQHAGLVPAVLDEKLAVQPGHVSVCTMHLAKGLEFRVVAVMACDDEVIPSQERIETVGDEAELEDVYNTERQLLYVACTRARDHLLVTSGGAASEFLDDLRG